MKYKPKTKPFKHQSRATLLAVRQRNHAIFFEPRLGKTKAALDWVGILALKGEVRRVLILAPRIALDVWEDELHKHFPYTYAAENFEEEWDYSPPGGVELPHPHEAIQFFLAGREETFRAERVGAKLVRRKQDELKRWGPDAIIFDESHEYKRPGARGSQDAWRLVKFLRSRSETGRPFVLLLSGTPNPKGWRDLFSQFRIMDDTLLGTNAGDFDEKYCVYGQGARKYTIIHYRNLSRLKRIIREHSTVCTARKAGLEGQLFFQSLRVSLPARVRAKYEELALDFAAELGGQLVTAKNQGVKRLRLAQITGGFLTDGTQIHREKLAKAKDWLSALHAQAEDVVIYAVFTPEVRALGKLAEELGFTTTVVDGGTSKSVRRQALQAFQTTGRTRPHALVFQVQAGSQSIELSRAAEVVFYSLPDGWVTFWQCLNRVRGPNQHRPVRVTAILARGTVDVSKLASLRKKEDWHGEMMKDPKRYLLGLSASG